MTGPAFRPAAAADIPGGRAIGNPAIRGDTAIILTDTAKAPRVLARLPEGATTSGRRPDPVPPHRRL